MPVLWKIKFILLIHEFRDPDMEEHDNCGRCIETDSGDK
jgi:hypothetical protein